MQDRFKFRAWNTLVKEFSYFDKPEMQIGTDGFDSGLIFPLSENSNLYMGKYSEPQFCTGLKDKNGKLIYEGDIVKDLTYLCEVKYVCAFLPIFGGLGLISNQDLKDYEFCKENWESYRINDKVRMLDNRFKLANQGNKLKCFNMNNLKMDDFEVIGNIYENPELLKEDE